MGRTKDKLMSTPMRDHILDVASDLFATRGINATGVDTIVATAGIAKMTLYKYFKSKEQLIVEYLQRHDAQLRQGLLGRLRKPAADSTPLFDLIHAVMEWIAEPDFKGFAFIGASIEFPQSENPVHQTSLEFAQALRGMITTSAEASGVKKPEILALQLSLLIEGAAMAEQMQHGTGNIEHTLAAAKTLIDAAMH
jgi:AcrR family transcriptional regulator